MIWNSQVNPMKELADQVFQTWGWKAVVAIVCAGFGIWGLAHFNSAPGTRVSVLWGLVEYTKQSPQAVLGESISPPTISQRNESFSIPKKSTPKESDQINSQESKHQGKVEVIGHDYSKASWSASRSELRKLRGLRELSALESGKRLDSMPAGTFGFVSNQDISMTIGRQNINGSDFVSELLRIWVQRFDSTSEMGGSFEIHSDRQADRFILGFTTETLASVITSSLGIKEVVLAAQPGVVLKSLILIDVRLLKNAGFRLIESSSGESDWVMDVALW